MFLRVLLIVFVFLHSQAASEKESFQCEHDDFREEEKKGAHRVAILIYGQSFRNWGSQGFEGTCCNLTDNVQENIIRSVAVHIVFAITKAGF